MCTQVGVVALRALKRWQYLILDERQQGADHQGHAFASQGWQLITQGLASSAWQQAEHVSALHDGIDDLTLQRPALVPVASTEQQHGKMAALACASMHSISSACVATQPCHCQQNDVSVGSPCVG